MNQTSISQSSVKAAVLTLTESFKLPSNYSLHKHFPKEDLCQSSRFPKCVEVIYYVGSSSSTLFILLGYDIQYE